MLKQALETGGAIYELKNMIWTGFNNCSVNFIPRTCNKVAHALAALGSLCPRLRVLTVFGIAHRSL